MAKTNYRKVENLVESGLQKMQVDHLLELADIASGTGKSFSDSKQKKLSLHQDMIIIEQSMKRMLQKDPTLFKQLKIEKKEYEKLKKKALASPEKLTEKEAEEIKALKKGVASYKAKLFANQNDKKIVDQEIVRHINKRMNVKETWLPLK